MRHAVSIAIALLLGATIATTARAATLTQVASFGSNPGALDMFEYVPDGLAANRPLVVVLHGCSQTAADMEHAGWDTLADTYRFAVLYPQQVSANNALECFDWFQPGDVARGGGEAASIASMIDTITAAAQTDTTRVYVTGLSSGGAFTAALLAAYPDRFAAGSVMSGVVAGCATDVASATSCQEMAASTQKTAAAWGDLARGADSGFAGTWPRVQIWQGTTDTTVYPANAGELVKQWTNVHGLDQTATATDTIGAATRTQYATSAGATVDVEEYLVTGMGHGVAIGSDALGTCPSTAATYFLDENICATLRAAAFFGVLDTGSGADAGTTGGDGSGGPGHDGADAGAATSSPAAGCGCATSHDRDLPGALVLVTVVVLMRRRSAANSI